MLSAFIQIPKHVGFLDADQNWETGARYFGPEGVAKNAHSITMKGERKKIPMIKIRKVISFLGVSSCSLIAMALDVNLNGRPAPPMAAPLQLTTEEDIKRILKPLRPLENRQVPKDFYQRVGSTHWAGRYHHSQKPFLLEGLDQTAAFGMQQIKLWFSGDYKRMKERYGYNSDWPKLADKVRLIDIAKLPDFHQAFIDQRFHTYALEAVNGNVKGWSKNCPGSEFFKETEEELYEVSKYLLETYASYDKTFILQNWEGSWLLKKGAGKHWSAKNVPHDAYERVERLTAWFKARQRGINRAREEIRNTRVKIYHAIEVCTIYEKATKLPLYVNNIPSVITHIVPKVAPDLVYWSAYQAKFNPPATFYNGLEILKHYTPPSEAFGENNVGIGEFGLTEYHGPVYAHRDDVVDIWDDLMAVMIKFKVSHLHQWAIYCNELRDRSRSQIWFREREKHPNMVVSMKEHSGLGLIQPDGSLSHTGYYFHQLFKLMHVQHPKYGWEPHEFPYSPTLHAHVMK